MAFFVGTLGFVFQLRTLVRFKDSPKDYVSATSTNHGKQTCFTFFILGGENEVLEA